MNAITVIMGILMGLLAVAGAVALAILLPALVVWWLWNALIVTHFGAPTLSFWAVAGILWLLAIVGKLIRGK